MISGFIPDGTMCDACFVPIHEGDDPVILEDIDSDKQVVLHGCCVPPSVQEQIKVNQRRMMAAFN